MSLRLLFLFCSAALVLPARTAAQPADCVRTLQTAEVAYEAGRFDEAARLVTPCVASAAFNREQTIRAHRLLSMSHANRGDAEGARLAILDLLQRVPDYQADPVQDPPAYVLLVSDLRDQLYAEAALPTAEPRPKWTRRPGRWLGLAGGLVIVGVTAVLAADGR